MQIPTSLFSCQGSWRGIYQSVHDDEGDVVGDGDDNDDDGDGDDEGADDLMTPTAGKRGWSMSSSLVGNGNGGCFDNMLHSALITLQN